MPAFQAAFPATSNASSFLTKQSPRVRGAPSFVWGALPAAVQVDVPSPPPTGRSPLAVSGEPRHTVTRAQETPPWPRMWTGVSPPQIHQSWCSPTKGARSLLATGWSGRRRSGRCRSASWAFQKGRDDLELLIRKLPAARRRRSFTDRHDGSRGVECEAVADLGKTRQRW